MGFPNEIQHDQEDSFMRVLTTKILDASGIKIVHMSVCHLQRNSVERFHRTLKRILRVLCIKAKSEYEQFIPAALFALEVIHESTGSILAVG